MAAKKNNAFIIIATIFYSCIWFAMHFIIVGFFMPTPVRFCKSISGNKSTKQNNASSSKYGLSDDPDLDEQMFYDTMDDD